MRPHELRHSYATILLATGEHPKVVQEILGHSSAQLTLDTYSHLLPDLKLKERAAATLDAILIGGKNNPGQNPGQTDPQQVDDQGKSSNSFGDDGNPTTALPFGLDVSLWWCRLNPAARVDSLSAGRDQA